MGRVESRQGEALFFAEYNRSWDKVLARALAQRKITQSELVKGLCSRTVNYKTENGILGWSRITRETVMQRMGISTEYFEYVTTEEELKRWRLREELCRSLIEKPDLAKERYAQLRRDQSRYSEIELQFLEKAALIWMMRDGESPDRILKQAEAAAACTIKEAEGWHRKLDRLLLSPAELEAVLLAAKAYGMAGQKEKAFELCQGVWNYPDKHGWDDRMKELILPFAAVFGIGLWKEMGAYETAFQMGNAAIDLLIGQMSQRYLYPLLTSMEQLPVGGEKAGKRQEELHRMRLCLDGVYERYGIPKERLWQTISFENTQDARALLLMLRRAHGKSQAAAVEDKNGNSIITERQLGRIETNKSHITEKNFKRLIAQYGKPEAVKMAMVCTDQAEVLRLRQEISGLIYQRRWEEARAKIGLFVKNIDAGQNTNKQQLLFWNGLIAYRMKEISAKECIGMLLEALKCTVSDKLEEVSRYTMYRRQEVLIINTIAAVYQEMGDLKSAMAWGEPAMKERNALVDKYGVVCGSYNLVMSGYTNILGDMGMHDEAMREDDRAAGVLLLGNKMNSLSALLYDWAWNAKEKQDGEAGEPELKSGWQARFRESLEIARFYREESQIGFLEKRIPKYL